VTPTGFAPDVNEKREVDRGQSIVYAGITERAQLEVQEVAPKWDAELFEGRLKVWTGPQMLAMVNKGVKNRGFRVCPDCGRAEPEYGPGFRYQIDEGRCTRPAHESAGAGVVWAGVADGPFTWAIASLTDVYRMRVRALPNRLGTPNTPGLLSRAARMGLSSLVEASLRRRVSCKLTKENCPVGGRRPGGHTDEAQLYFTIAAGRCQYARALASLSRFLDATERLLSQRECAQSCYRIRHYRNNLSTRR
jgi:hypothetical protein